AALGWFGAPGIAKLVQLAGEDDADARRRAVIELGRAGIDSEEVLAALRQRLADADPRVRAESHAAQCNLLEFDIDQLAASLKTNRHPLVRMTALRVLAKWPEKTAEIFIPALNDEDKSIQRAAMGQLGQLGAEAQAAAPALANLLDSDDRDTAWAASRALGHIGPAARGAVERLLVCLSDRDFHMRSFANHALRRIGCEGQMRPPQLFAALKADGNSARSLIFWAPDPPSAGTAGQVPVGQRPADELGYGISDADLEHVKDLTHLVALNLTDNPVGDAGLANLADLKELKYLYLCNTNITSAGLRHLAGLTSLERLDLGACAITDDGLTHLADLRSLRDLVLYGTQVTDAGLAHLQSLTTLEDISLPDGVTLKGLTLLGGLTVIDPAPRSTSDADLPPLLSLTRLRTLGLSHSSITDHGLETVGKLSSIEDLDLRRTQVTDAGLAHLKSLSKLRFLWLEDTRVSKRGVEQLKESLPDLTVGGVPGVALPQRKVEYEVIGLKSVVAIRP
ncbi:MAG TPA: HEAT repeat domain-containing protein, partial [Pirellulales bacterium]